MPFFAARSRSSSLGSEEGEGKQHSTTTLPKDSTNCHACVKFKHLHKEEVVRDALQDTKTVQDFFWEQFHTQWFKVPAIPELPKQASCLMCGSLEKSEMESKDGHLFDRLQKKTKGALYCPNLRSDPVAYDAISQLPPPPAASSTHTMRVVCVSDTHDCHWQLTVPDGDVLVHSGDILLCSRRFSVNFCKRKLRNFNAWLGTLPHKHKYVVGGNHDIYLELMGREVCQAILTNATYCVHDEVQVPHPTVRSAYLRMFLTPFSKGKSGNAAFQPGEFPVTDFPERLKKIHSNLGCCEPTETGALRSRPGKRPYDIVVSHAPMMTRMPVVDPAAAGVKKKAGWRQQAGAPHWAHVHIGGHLHAHYGAFRLDDTFCVVACSMDGKYQLRNNPVVLDCPLQVWKDEEDHSSPTRE